MTQNEMWLEYKYLNSVPSLLVCITMAAFPLAGPGGLSLDPTAPPTIEGVVNSLADTKLAM